MYIIKKKKKRIEEYHCINLRLIVDKENQRKEIRIRRIVSNNEEKKNRRQK